MSWFKYDCKFCDETCSIDIFGFHLMENHFDHLSGSILMKDGRVCLLSVTTNNEDMFMCTACGFAVKTQATFDKHLRTKGEEHRKRHLANICAMKSSTFNGSMNYISDIEIEEEEEEEEVIQPVPKRRKVEEFAGAGAGAGAGQPRLALPLSDRFNQTYSDLLQIYNELQKENWNLRQQNEELTKKINSEKKQREDAIKLLSIK
jgi:hypothetical protein